MYQTTPTAYGQPASAVSQSTIGKGERPSIIDALARSVMDARQQVGDLAMRARGIADDVFGAMPQGETTNNVPAFAGKAGAVEEQVRGLLDAIAELRTQIDRLTCI